MNLTILSRNSSLYSSQQYQSKTNQSKQDIKSNLYCSTAGHSTALSSSFSSANNSKLYSSTVTLYPFNFAYQSSQQKKHLCQEHFKKFTYTCITCNQNVCSVCLSNLLKHRSHRFQRYNEKKQDFRILCSNLCTQINFKKNQFSKIILDYQNNKSNQQNTHNKKIQNLQQYNKKIAEQYNKISLDAQKNLNSLKNTLNQFNNDYKQTLSQLKNCSKISMLKTKGFGIENKIGQKFSKIQCLQLKGKKINVNNLIRPSFYTSIFIVQKFTSFKEAGKQRIFQPFEAYGSIWKFKVYPGGYVGAKIEDRHKGVQYTSLYIERTDGVLSVGRYCIQVQVTSRKDPRLRIRKEFQSEFAKNQSWGYDRFTKLSNIYQHGFLGDDDSLFIKVSICPYNFYEANRVFNSLIQQKERKFQQNQRKIKILKVMLEKKRNVQQFSQYFFQNNKKQLIIQSLMTDQSIRKLEPIKQEAKIETQNKNECENQNQNEIQVEQSKNSPNISIRLGQNISRMSKYQVGQKQKQRQIKINQRNGTLNLQRKRTIHNCPSISLEKKSPGKLIRLVSLKNTQLIENSKKKIHNRSSTYC